MSPLLRAAVAASPALLVALAALAAGQTAFAWGALTAVPFSAAAGWLASMSPHAVGPALLVQLVLPLAIRLVGVIGGGVALHLAMPAATVPAILGLACGIIGGLVLDTILGFASTRTTIAEAHRA